MKGHVPVRIVMSQTCNLPEEANLWNVHEAYTIVATQRGARRDFQKKLAMKGVEVVEFDMLNPRDVMSYCYDRGYLSVLWECGGTLSAAAISARVIHKVNTFCFTIWLPCAFTYLLNILHSSPECLLAAFVCSSSLSSGSEIKPGNVKTLFHFPLQLKS